MVRLKVMWTVLLQDDQPRVFPVPSSSHSTCSMDSPTGLKKREAGVSLAANFTANNRWEAIFSCSLDTVLMVSFQTLTLP